MSKSPGELIAPDKNGSRRSERRCLDPRLVASASCCSSSSSLCFRAWDPSSGFSTFPRRHGADAARRELHHRFAQLLRLQPLLLRQLRAADHGPLAVHWCRNVATSSCSGFRVTAGNITSSASSGFPATDPDDQGQALDQRPARATRAGAEDARPFRRQRRCRRLCRTASRGGSYRIIEAAGDSRPYDNTPEFVVPAGPPVRARRQPRQLHRQPRPVARFGVGFVPIELVIGRVIATF